MNDEHELTQRIVEESHFWLDLILGHVLAITVFDNLRRFPMLLSLSKIIANSKLFAKRDLVGDFSREKVAR